MAKLHVHMLWICKPSRLNAHSTYYIFPTNEKYNYCPSKFVWKDTCAQSRDFLPANHSNEVKKNAENYNNGKNRTEFCVNEVSPPREYFTITDWKQSSTCLKIFVREGLLTCFQHSMDWVQRYIYLFMGHLCAFLWFSRVF